MSDHDEELDYDQDEETTPRRSCKTRLKFNNEREDQELSTRDEFDASDPAEVENFIDGEDLNLNQNHSNSKGGKQKANLSVRQKVPADFDFEGETDTYDSDGVIVFKGKPHTKTRKRKAGTAAGGGKAKAKCKAANLASTSGGPSSEEENKRFMEWCERFEQFRQWEAAQNKKQRDQVNEGEQQPTVPGGGQGFTSPYDDEGDDETGEGNLGQKQNHKATQSPSDSTIYSRLCKSVSEVEIGANKTKKQRTGECDPRAKSANGFAIDRMLDEVRHGINPISDHCAGTSASQEVVSHRNVDLRVKLDRSRSYQKHRSGSRSPRTRTPHGRWSEPRQVEQGGARRDREELGSDDSDVEEETRRSRQAERESKDRRDKILVDTELRRAELLKPGKVNLKHLIYDAQHKSLGCRIDKSLKLKCMRGEFVDLERLLPKKPLHSGRDRTRRLTLVSATGDRPRFIEEADDNVINSYKKWEAAFEVYASLYVRANPGRADELYDYKHLIRDGANDYIWDNVYDYDIEFREHMDEHPDRMWSEMLVKEWARRVKIHLNQRPGGNSRIGQSGVRQEWRDPNDIAVCRRYNAGRCTYGKACKFAHRCQVCGKHGHGASICRKRSDRSDKPDKSDSKMSVSSHSSRSSSQVKR